MTGPNVNRLLSPGGGGRLLSEIEAKLDAGDPDEVRAFLEAERVMRGLARRTVPKFIRAIQTLSRLAQAWQSKRRQRRVARSRRCNVRAPRRNTARQSVGTRGPPSSDEDAADPPPSFGSRATFPEVAA